MTAAAIKTYNPWLIAIIVSMATFMEVLDTTIVNVSLPHIAGSLAASPEEGTWILTSYLVANGIILPLSGWLSDVFGRKKFFLICIVGFTISSLLCGIATSLPMLIVCRLLQGLMGGGLQPMQQAIIMDAFPVEKRGMVFGITGITIIAAPICGPILGGWLTDTYSWHWVFYINIPVGLFTFFCALRVVKDPPHAVAKDIKKIDYTGLGFVALGLGALQVVLDRGQQEDWLQSSFIIQLIILSIVALALAAFWLLRQKEPLVDLRLLADRSFGLSTLLVFAVGFMLYSSTALIPLMVQTQFGYNSFMAGMILSPGAIVVLFCMPLAGKIVSYLPCRYLVMCGMAICGLGCFMTSTVITPYVDYQTLVHVRIIQTLGFPLLFIPISTLAFMNIGKEKINKASALFSLSRNLGGSVGIAVASTYLFRYGQINQGDLTGRLVPGDIAYETTLQQMTAAGVSHGLTQAEAAAQASGMMYNGLLKQSSLMAYQDTFLFLTCILAAGFIIAMFLPYNNPRKKAEPTLAH